MTLPTRKWNHTYSFTPDSSFSFPMRPLPSPINGAVYHSLQTPVNTTPRSDLQVLSPWAPAPQMELKLRFQEVEWEKELRWRLCKTPMVKEEDRELLCAASSQLPFPASGTVCGLPIHTSSASSRVAGTKQPIKTRGTEKVPATPSKWTRCSSNFKIVSVPRTCHVLFFFPFV